MQSGAKSNDKNSVKKIIGSPGRRCGDRHGMDILLLVMLIPFNLYSMRSYNFYMENQAALFHVLNQMQTKGVPSELLWRKCFPAI